MSDMKEIKIGSTVRMNDKCGTKTFSGIIVHIKKLHTTIKGIEYDVVCNFVAHKEESNNIEVLPDGTKYYRVAVYNYESKKVN